MLIRTRLLGAAATAAVCISDMPGQQLRLLDAVGIATATHDLARGRIIAIGHDLETREFDGIRWRISPQPRPAGIGDVQVVFDTWLNRVTACRSMAGRAMLVERFDGVQWQTIPTPIAPPERRYFACAFDAQRGQLVLFGGYFTGFVPTNETWTFDGAAWTLRTPATMPPPLANTAMTYDAARGRIVLFDGSWPSPATTTWEWDGSNWQAIATAITPAPREGAVMGYDPVRARVVLFGGVKSVLFDDTWEYDGITWSQAVTPTRPPARYTASLVFDPAIGEMRLIGGHGWPGECNDMWSWNGSRWLQHPTPAHPGPRGASLGQFAVTMADPQARGMVMYYPDPQAATSTWLFDAAGWHAVAGPSPSPRFEPMVCSSLPRSYLYGGMDATTGNSVPDLWSFDGSAWTLESNTGPAPRRGGAISHDLFTNELVLFGGATAWGVNDETWVFDGTNWMLRQPTTRPLAREGHAMAFDFNRGKTVLAGGYDVMGAQLNDTWEWDGTNWSQVTTAVNLPFSYGQLAFDRQLNQLVMVLPHSEPAEALAFDGIDWRTLAIGPSAFIGPWITASGFPYAHGLIVTDYDGVYLLTNTPAQSSHYGTACTATAPDLGADEWPRLGAASFGVDVVRAPASSLVALLGAVQSANVSIAGCTQLVQPGQAVWLLATSASGLATAPLPLPNNPAYLGVDLFFQVAALAASAPAGFTLSRGLRLTLGN